MQGLTQKNLLQADLGSLTDVLRNLNLKKKRAFNDAASI